MNKNSLLIIVFLACSLMGYGQGIPKNREMETFSKEGLEQAQTSINNIINKIENSLVDKEKPFALAMRLKAKPESMDKVITSYKGQKALAVKNEGNLVYYVGLDVNGKSIFIYESFIKHERDTVTLLHLARTAGCLEKERNLQIVTDSFKKYE